MLEMKEMEIEELQKFTTELAKIAEKELPFNISYRFSKMFDDATRELKTFADKRTEAILKYCAKDESGVPIKKPGGVYEFSIDDSVKFEEEMKELLKEKAEIKIRKTKLSELAGFNISLKGLMMCIEDDITAKEEKAEADKLAEKEKKNKKKENE